MKYKIRYQQAQKKKKNDLQFIKKWSVIAVLCTALLFGWLWYDGVIFFAFESERKNAFVTESNLVPVRGTFYGVRYLQGVHYEYIHNNESYVGIKQIGNKLGTIQPGDSIAIEILKRRPEISRIDYP